MLTQDFRNKYYENTKDQCTSPVLEYFLSNVKDDLTNTLSLDIGAGGGKDTKTLANHGSNVIAIDNMDITNFIEEQKITGKYSIMIDDIDTMTLPLDTDIIYSGRTLNLGCSKEQLQTRIQKIHTSLKNGGFFVGNIWGAENQLPTSEALITLEELKKYFTDRNIIYIDEHKQNLTAEESSRKIPNSIHIINIIAQKK